MFVGIYDEVAADIATVLIFIIFLYYIIKEIRALEIRTSTLLIALGIITVGISDIISLVFFNPTVDCYMGKVTAVGALIASLGILHSVTVYPKKTLVHKSLPSLYTLSIVMVIYLFASPHFLYCDAVTGGEHGPFWDIFVIWVYVIFFTSAILLFLRLLTAKARIVRLRYFYMSTGVGVTLIYLFVAQVFPVYEKSMDYFTAVHILPFMGAMFLIAMLRYGMFIIQPSQEYGQFSGEHDFRDGEIIGISSVHHAYMVFRDIITREPGIVVSVRPAELIAERYLLKKTPIIWLTYFPKGYPLAVVPDRLQFEVMDSLIHFVHNGGRVILIDGLEYIMANFGRRFAIEFVNELHLTGKNVKIILAVSDEGVVEGLADTTFSKNLTPSEPRIMTVRDSSEIPVNDTLIITTHTRNFRDDWKNASLLHIGDGFNADRLIFEGIKKIEDSKQKNVYIECMDYLLSMEEEKSVMNILKDIIDVTITKGGKVYIRYTPRLKESYLISQFIDFIG